MFEAAYGMAEQMAAALAAVETIDGLPDHDDIENVLVLGMGGSGVAGDVLATVAGPFLPVPLVVSKDYELPGFVGRGTLVVAISFSGGTEETLEAVGEAADDGARIVAICAGGELARVADDLGEPVLRVIPGIPMPRAGLGALVVPALVVLEETGLFPGATEWIALAIEQLRRRVERERGPRSVAQHLARSIGRTVPLVYGGSPLGYTAAQRWKASINENAKAPAFANRIPELCHNEVAGWGQHGDVTRQVLTLVELRHDHEHPQVGRRFELVNELTAEVVAGIETVQAEGEGALAQLLDLILGGDLLSLHLAANEGIDPGPIPALEYIKARLTG